MSEDEGSGAVIRDHNFSGRGPSGMSSVREARMERRAIERGWISGSRWDTRLTEAEIEKKPEAERTLVEKALLRTHKGIRSEDDRVASQYVRAVVAMEAQVQRDDLACDSKESLLDPSLPASQPVNQTTVNIQQNVVAGEIEPNERLRQLIQAALTRKPPQPHNGNGHSNGNGHAKES